MLNNNNNNNNSVVAYVLLCGYEPFYGTDDAELIKANKTVDYQFHSPEWDSVRFIIYLFIFCFVLFLMYYIILCIYVCMHYYYSLVLKLSLG